MNLKLITIIIALAVTAGYTDVGIGVKGGLSLYKAPDDRCKAPLNPTPPGISGDPWKYPEGSTPMRRPQGDF